MEYNIQGQTNKTSNILCMVSISLMFIAIVGIPLMALDSGPLFEVSDSASYLLKELAATGNLLFPALMGVCIIIASTLMIVARIRTPRNVFAKVLMWVYIAGYIIYVIITISLLALAFWGLGRMIP